MATSLTLKRKFALFGREQAVQSDTLQPAVQRFVLPGGHDISSARQPLRLPEGFHSIRIVAGSAYVSYNREDHVLYSGSELKLDHGSADAVISSLGASTLVFEAVS